MEELNWITIIENTISLWSGLCLWWVTVHFQDILRKLDGSL